MTDEDLKAIEDRAAAATPGPWEWYGNTKYTGNFYLSTKNRGRIFVMDFVRWGMRGAQPRFQKDHLLVNGSELVNYEVKPGAKRGDPQLYREDFIGILHPDAIFIAAARSDVAALTEEVRRLRDLVGKKTV